MSDEGRPAGLLEVRVVGRGGVVMGLDSPPWTLVICEGFPLWSVGPEQLQTGVRILS